MEKGVRSGNVSASLNLFFWPLTPSIKTKMKPKKIFMRRCKRCKTIFMASSKMTRICPGCVIPNRWSKAKNERELQEL